MIGPPPPGMGPGPPPPHMISPSPPGMGPGPPPPHMMIPPPPMQPGLSKEAAATATAGCCLYGMYIIIPIICFCLYAILSIVIVFVFMKSDDDEMNKISEPDFEQSNQQAWDEFRRQQKTERPRLNLQGGFN